MKKTLFVLRETFRSQSEEERRKLTREKTAPYLTGGLKSREPLPKGGSKV